VDIHDIIVGLLPIVAAEIDLKFDCVMRIAHVVKELSAVGVELDLERMLRRSDHCRHLPRKIMFVSKQFGI
jgi:hypothetical protein